VELISHFVATQRSDRSLESLHELDNLSDALLDADGTTWVRSER
jgi:hypothetical protein